MNKLTKIAGLLIILRDDIEEEQLSQELKHKANSLLRCINKHLDNICKDKEIGNTIVEVAIDMDNKLNEL
jgi:hypothetical protein